MKNQTVLNQKGVVMLRTFLRIARFIENYRHYRRRGHFCKDAWHLAGMTLPQ